MSRTTISGVEPDAKCKDCELFTPDTINPNAGLGDCPEEKPDVLMPTWEHGQQKWVYQKKLTYPRSEACGKFKRKATRNADA